MKDRFSADANAYANFRPGYPADLVACILSNVSGRSRAWDCATGNGQMAALLAPHFRTVDATDISANQLAQAPQLSNVHYSIQAAEKTAFPDQVFDLITVAQAIHWFDFEEFYSEVRRVAAPGSLLAVVGYPLLRINPTIDAVIDHFYHHVIGDHWDKERRYLDAEYATIPFPFHAIECPRFASVYDWKFEQLIGYLHTWSAVGNAIRAAGINPLEALEPDLLDVWGDAVTHQVHFPMILRLGRL